MLRPAWRVTGETKLQLNARRQREAPARTLLQRAPHVPKDARARSRLAIISPWSSSGPSFRRARTPAARDGGGRGQGRPSAPSTAARPPGGSRAPRMATWLSRVRVLSIHRSGPGLDQICCTGSRTSYSLRHPHPGTHPRLWGTRSRHEPGDRKARTNSPVQGGSLA